MVVANDDELDLGQGLKRDSRGALSLRTCPVDGAHAFEKHRIGQGVAARSLNQVGGVIHKRHRGRSLWARVGQSGFCDQVAPLGPRRFFARGLPLQHLPETFHDRAAGVEETLTVVMIALRIGRSRCAAAEKGHEKTEHEVLSLHGGSAKKG